MSLNNIPKFKSIKEEILWLESQAVFIREVKEDMEKACQEIENEILVRKAQDAANGKG